MNDRIIKYLYALERRRKSLSARQLESLSSDFDLSTRDLDLLRENSQRQIQGGFILDSSELRLNQILRIALWGAFHDKDVLLELLPVLEKRYKRDKRKFVFDTIVLALKQAKNLGASDEELDEFEKLLHKSAFQRFSKKKYLLFFFLFLGLALMFFLYKESDSVFLLSNASKYRSSSDLYLGSLKSKVQDEPIKDLRHLPIDFVTNQKGVHLKEQTSQVVMFPESYFYDLRAGIFLPSKTQAFHYTLDIKDIQGNTIESFEQDFKEPIEGLWKEGRVIPFEFQKFQMGRPKKPPYSLNIKIDRLKKEEEAQSSRWEESSYPSISVQSSQEVSLKAFLIQVEWKDIFGFYQGEFLLDISLLKPLFLKELKVRFIILDKSGDILGSIEKILLDSQSSLSFSAREPRYFILKKDFLKIFSKDIVKNAKSYQMEVLEWR